MNRNRDEEDLETSEWLASLDEVLKRSGPERITQLLEHLSIHANASGVSLPFTANTPYRNTINPAQQPAYPGNLEIEERITSLIRWNAMAMVVRANRAEEGIGGHISTYASAATLYEVAFHHFFRGRTDTFPGDLVYFQGHASPGIYARALLEGRLTVEQVDQFRHELHATPGLSSYPHPWLMPDFWQFPTVSMGLGPLQAIYHARFIKYLEDRGLRAPAGQRVWAFVGDGETDEPESLGAITLAAREKLDNLIFVVNCNLQRLDGPVRGNGKIIQELEAVFRGAGWNAIKVIWGGDWDPLLAQDSDDRLLNRMQQVVDGQYQKYAVEPGAYMRQDFFGADPLLLKRVEHLTDDQIKRLNRGGHDAVKVHAAYAAAIAHTGSPTVILCKTIKGYGLGAFGEAHNVTHQQKKLNDEALRGFRTRFNIPLSDEQVNQLPFYVPPPDSEEMRYLKERRAALGSYLPRRITVSVPLQPADPNLFDEFMAGTGDRAVSTTMAFVRMLAKLLHDPGIGKSIVPMVPDEARTFGMDALFRQCGIYSHPGQLYEPVDKENLLYYKEATDGQILEEGITEAGCLSSFIAAGTSHANHGIPMIPFFTFYSMFGLQRVGDLIWAAADNRTRGFLMGATSGRTTLAGEGLQHQDGNSHLLAMTVPTLRAYDPSYAYELACIIRDGLQRMFRDGEDIFYYLTVMNENYPQPPMPDGCTEGILRGLYGVAPADGDPQVHLLGSGAILREALAARTLLADSFGIRASVWSATSYKTLHDDACDVERWNRLHPHESPRIAHLAACLGTDNVPVVAATDYVRAVPDSVGRWLGSRFTTLGTDGFGRSDGRAALRDFFEVDAKHITFAALSSLAASGHFDSGSLEKAADQLGIDRNRDNPVNR
ncbi:MAG: pyruvate dehydrogenase (acetyl-transferring), homodimeric type [Lentisphaerae bacterium RIFOXYC12_FULL_60_16]|nr:MAG: pyruvate dehydrogenase (acetyl-transferring), homodimeric type [Lentisphaerae bacterium RIFOXYC12_FULL_60_16]